MVKGEMKVSEIRNLVRQHNKLQTIKNVDRKSRAVLIAEVKKLGYGFNHDKKMIQRITTQKLSGGKMKVSTVRVSEAGATKPQKRTKLKKLKEGGAAPILRTQDDLDKELIRKRKKKKELTKKKDQLKKGYPDIPENVKGRKKK
jgi:hypothetical protein